MAALKSFDLRCFRNGQGHMREYQGTNYRQAMEIALQQDKWDFVETFNGSYRAHPENGKIPTAGFGQLAEAVEQYAQLQDRAERKRSQPVVINHETQTVQGFTHPLNSLTNGNPPMDEPPILVYRELREAIKAIAWYLPPEFRRKHIEEQITVRLGRKWNESSLGNLIDNLHKEGTFIRVRPGYYKLQEGFAVPPPVVRPTNPLDAIFPPKNVASPAPQPPEAKKPEALSTPRPEVPPPPAAAAPLALPTPAGMLQNSLVSLMSLSNLIAVDTKDDESFLLEAMEAYDNMTKICERFAGMIAKYQAATKARAEFMQLMNGLPSGSVTPP